MLNLEKLQVATGPKVFYVNQKPDDSFKNESHTLLSLTQKSTSQIMSSIKKMPLEDMDPE
jgi:hypothetical protein